MSGFLTLLGAAAVVAAMVLLYLRVLPKKLDGTFSNRYLQMLHNYFNFKTLYIESVLKFLFTLLTVCCIVVGIVGVLSAIFGLLGGLVDLFDYGGRYFRYLIGNFFSTVLGSIAIAVIGPVMVRLVYEGTMMLIMLVKNVIDINNKIKASAEDVPAAPPSSEG